MPFKDPEMTRKCRRSYYSKNRERLLQQMKEYRDNPDKTDKNARAAYHHGWYVKNAEQIAAANRTPEGRMHRRLIHARYRSSVNGKIASRLRCRLWAALHRHGVKKKVKTIDILGCTFQELIDHLVSLFTEDMTIELLMNGEIEVDHIRPCASFDLTNLEQQRACFHYTNLQPLWRMDNRRKWKTWV